MRTATYGSWKSPITSKRITEEMIQFGQAVFDGDDLYWIEQRPKEGGRNVLVHRAPDGMISDVTPKPFNARTRVHEYGGGAFAVDRGIVYFSNFSDQRLYRQDRGSAPRPLTPSKDMRYADGVIDRNLHRLIAVREDHTAAGEAINTLVAVDLDGDNAGGKMLVGGNDFYSNPRLNPNGTRLCWLTWNHPNMPWDGNELWVGELGADGSISHARRVAGGQNESIFQPEWSPDGRLYFASDRTGWWNLYRLDGDHIQAMQELAAEFGMPQWVFGQTSYAFETARNLICVYNQKGSHLAALDTATRQLDEIKTDFTSIQNPRVSDGRVLFIGGSATQAPALVLLDLKSRKATAVRRSIELTIDPGYLSTPQAIEFPTENRLTAHAFYYPPKNKDYAAPIDEKPPLIVKSHGGPTGSTGMTLRPDIQFWTSRGFAVVDVNYGGSTGYGRAYRERLNGNWGVVDVDDCANAARYLVKQGWVDGKRLAITGGSAGGYTTLTSIALRDLYTAAASHFGIGDLEVFAKDTHKYESRYLDRLVGPYPAALEVYRARSAIHFIDRINCPLILLQGLEDKIVPPNQAQMMFEAVRKKGLPCAYIAFKGEQHGFRQAKNIRRSLDAELYFYSRVFGFRLAEPIVPVRIDNLNTPRMKRQGKLRSGPSKDRPAVHRTKTKGNKRSIVSKKGTGRKRRVVK